MKKIGCKGISMLVIGMMVMTLIPGVVSAQGEQTTFIIALQNDMPNMNQMDPDTNTVWKNNILSFCFEALYDTDPDYVLYPVLADETQGTMGYEIDATGMNVTVHIKEGITFQDGTPMNADDVVFSFQTLVWGLYQSTVGAALYWEAPIWDHFSGTGTSHVGIEKVDDYEVEFHLAKPYALFFIGVLTTPIIPKHIWHPDYTTTTGVVNLTDPSASVTSDDLNLDMSWGTDPSEIDVTMGTGPWMLEEWVPLTYSSLVVYEDYWGKDNARASVTWKGDVYNFYPDHLKKILYTIYNTLDVATLALKKGDVHYIAWSLTPGFYNDLKNNPAIGINVGQDSGFFYISWNLRKYPWDDLALREAMSYCIDKDYIVNRLMGGFGTKGSVPISVTNPRYINESAVPPPFNLAMAETILNNNGYTDKDSDGWRDAPDGTPIKTSILTPPKDYDPVRADAGIMISKNLKSVGLNIDASPTSFDTIVTKVFVEVNFDVYILGWATGAFPELYLRDFFHSSMDCAINPAGANSAGYNNAQVDAWIDEMEVEMDDVKRTALIKDISGQAVEDLPWNPLYYRKTIEGYRQDVWANWVPVEGTTRPILLNGFTLSKLAPPEEYVPPEGDLDVSLYVPSTVTANSTITGQVMVAQNNQPVDAADVTITPSYGGTISLTTNTKGYTSFTTAIPFQVGTASFTAIVEKGTVNGSAVAEANVVVPTPIAQLKLSSTDVVVNASYTGATGNTATVTATVTDKEGNGIEGVTVNVDTALMFGTVDEVSKDTDANGVATFTYSGASKDMITNSNLYDIFKATINVPYTIIPEVQSATLVIGVENNERSWIALNVMDVDTYVLDLNTSNDNTTWINATSNITVKVTDDTGAAVSGVGVTASLSDDTVAGLAADTVVSDGSGLADFSVTVSDDSNSTNVIVTFTNKTAYSLSDSVSLLITNGTGGYAADMDFSSEFVDPNDEVDVTITVYNYTGGKDVSIGTEVTFMQAFADLGSPGNFDDGAYVWWFGDVCDGVTDASGMFTTTISTLAYPPDIAALMTAYVGTAFNYTAEWFFDTEEFTFTDQYLLKRAPLAAMYSSTLDKPFFEYNDNSGVLTLKFGDMAGAIVGSDISFYEGIGGAKSKLDDIETNSAGEITYNYIAPKTSSSSGLGFTAIVKDPQYAVGFPLEFYFPYIVLPPTLIVTAEPTETLAALGDTIEFDVTVLDIYGVPLEDATVMSGTSIGTTDENGEATLEFIASKVGLVDVSFTAFGSGTGYATAGILVSEGVFTYSGLTLPSEIIKGETTEVTITVANGGSVGGTTTVELEFDGEVIDTKSVYVGAGQTETVTFSQVFDEDGTVGIGDQTATITPEAAAVVTAGIDMYLFIGVAIILLLLGLVGGYFFGKSRKPAGVEGIEEEMPLEEEVPIEEEIAEEEVVDETPLEEVKEEEDF